MYMDVCGSMTNTKEHRRGDNILFYRIGMGSEDKTPPNGWKIRTLSTLVKEFNDTGVRFLSFHGLSTVCTTTGGLVLID